MFKIDLLKEISKKSEELKNNNESTIVNQVQLLLESENQKDKELLKAVGLGHHIIEAENTKSVNIERKTFFDKYGDFLTESQVEDIASKYGLKCLPIHMYKGNISPTVAADIKEFIKKHNINEGMINSGNFKNCLSILAPASNFTLKVIPKDLVLFYNPNKYNKDLEDIFIPVAKWGNDFTYFRRLVGLLYNYPFPLSLFSISLVSGIIASIFGNVGVNVFIFIFLTAFFILNFVSLGDSRGGMYNHKDSGINDPFEQFKKYA
jgi:hypothetical protein